MAGVLTTLDRLAQDARYALRLLRRSPGFAAAALATLALAIGVNAAVWSVVDSLLLRPLPYPEPERLALLSVTQRSDRGEYRSTAVDGRTWELYRDESSSFERAVFSGWGTGVNLVAPGGGAANVQQQRVGAGFFRVLGVHMLHGREFLPEEDGPEGPAVAVLSHGLWASQFGADPTIVGRTALVRGEPTEVVGVLPPHFVSLDAATGGQESELYTPLRASTTGEGGGTNYQVVARLPSGLSWDEANAEAAAVGQADFLSRERREGVTATYALTSLQRALTSDLVRPLMLLWSAVGLVLLIACVDIAGLLLARGRTRAHEIATRAALGGGRRSIVRMLLVESLLLALLGGVLGVVVGQLALRGLLRLSRDVFTVGEAIDLDARAVVVTFALSLLAAVLFGLLPALQASRLDVRSAIASSGGGRGVAGGASRSLQRALVVGEVALGVVMLVGAGLLVRTFLHLQRLEPGFEPGQVVVARASLQDSRYHDVAAVERLFAESVARLERLPGVEAAAVSLGLPYERLLNTGFELVDAGVAEPPASITNLAYVTPRFFETFGMPLRTGRSFRAGDGRDDPGVAIVNEAFVTAYLGDRDALGLRLGAAGRERIIVGVAGDVQQRPGWGEYGPLAPMPMVYVPASQVKAEFLELVHTWFTPAWSVRVDGGLRDASRLGPAIREALGAVDPQLPVAEIASMPEVMGRSLAGQRFLMMLVSVLGSLAALLAALGLHGLIAGAVAERERETGIRIALGATGVQAMRRLALPGIGLALVGVAVGTVAALLAVRVLGSLLFGVAPTDPATFVAVALLLLGIAVVASTLPALRVLRHDPVATLRGH
ncbi:MAG TPA: ADOP family duplicated permease [Thermoanaerobaculia bacterium]|nr:ADOP family duplicated permease [Thermoanaerobaculia bacterium]